MKWRHHCKKLNCCPLWQSVKSYPVAISSRLDRYIPWSQGLLSWVHIAAHNGISEWELWTLTLSELTHICSSNTILMQAVPVYNVQSWLKTICLSMQLTRPSKHESVCAQVSEFIDPGCAVLQKDTGVQRLGVQYCGRDLIESRPVGHGLRKMEHQGIQSLTNV